MKPSAGPHIFASFQVRNYRLQWPADLFVSWGFELETMLLGWYVLTKSNSVLLMAAIGALAYVGTLFSPLFGVLGDRIGLRRTLCLMRAFYFLNAILLLGMAWFDHLNVGVVFAIAAATGLVRPSDLGVRTALVANTVSAEVLPGAIGLSRTTFDSARIFAALSGAGLFAVFGIASAYVLVVACYISSLILTFWISEPGDDSQKGARAIPRPETHKEIRTPTRSRARGRVISPKGNTPVRDLIEGLRYIWQTPSLRASMLVACLVNLTVFPWSIGLLPYVARDVLGGGELLLGHLLAGYATGALAGSILIMVMPVSRNPGRRMIVYALVWHMFIVGLAFSTNPWLSIGTMFGAGLAQSLSMLSLLLVILRASAPHLRGRVMGVRMMAIYSLPIGLVIAGQLIPRFGFTETALAYTGVGVVLTLLIAIRWRAYIWDAPEAAKPT